MAKQMRNHHFKLRNKLMRGEGSLFSHKLLKSLTVAGQKTLHQLDRG